MEQTRKILIYSIIIFILTGMFAFNSFAKEKKLVANRNGVKIHLEPDVRSDVIAVLEAGTELMLASDRKFKKAWNYVYFPSKKTAAMRSGYIHDNGITRLYKNTTVVTLEEKGRTRSEKDQIHFRKTSWGMSKSQVMASEGRGGEFSEKNGFSVLHYQENLLSQACELNYIFCHNRLTGAKYRFEAPQADQDSLETSYQQIRHVIAGQYGPPEEKNSNGMAGNVSLLPVGREKPQSEDVLQHAFWTTPATEIKLLFYKSGRHIILDVEYLGVEYKEFAQPRKVHAGTKNDTAGAGLRSEASLSF